jgi:cell division protease FtsH
LSKTIRNAILYIALPLALFLSVLAMLNQTDRADNPKYHDIVALFDSHQIEEFSLNLASGELKYKVKDSGNEWKKYNLPDVGLFIEYVYEPDVAGYNQKQENPEDKIVEDIRTGTSTRWITDLLPTLLIIAVAIGFWVYMMRKMNQQMGGGDKTLGFGRAKIRKASDDKRKTTFADVAGADEEKEELKELVDFLKSPKKFNELGARIPKGVLLVGPPGTGKTLLARAVAGEAGVPFFLISGSDFVEMFVGVGAARVRDLFDQAKRNAPSIVFIDEIDAVGRQRGAGLGGGHDEREQTLNQLLVEMDGFGANEGVIIIAATNRPDVLDKALLRPGRFDRQVTVNYPDVKGREEILKVHARGKPLGPDIDLKTIARSTAGFTGADLENVLNEAALLAARMGQKAITEKNIEESTIKVVMGAEKRSAVMTDKDKMITAYHEAGHAIVAHFLPSQDPVHQISIIPRGMAAGYTMYVPTDDKKHVSRQELFENICSLLGGRAAEFVTQDDICTGASNDIQRATGLARDIITKYGMSELGPIVFGTGHEEVFLGRDFSATPNYSEKTAAQIDDEIERIVTSEYNRAVELVKQHTDKLHNVAEFLFKNEKMDAAQFKKIMENGEISIDN